MSALLLIAATFLIVPGIALPLSSVFISKKPFQAIIWEVKKKCFIR